MKPGKKSCTIFKAHFEKLQKANSRFSIRSLSRKVGVSHSFLVNILNGKSLLPLTRLDDLCDYLKINSEDRDQLRHLIMLEKANIDVEKFGDKRPQSSKVTELLPENHLVILEEWRNLALLELLSCYPESGLNLAEILARLDFTPTELEASLIQLKNFDLIKETSGQRFHKSKETLKIPTRGPNPSTRIFYKKTLQLAQAELLRTDQEDFERRLITSISCAVNPIQIPLAKQRLAEALREVRDILTEGECTDVFFLQAQLFSVLKHS